MESHAFLLTDIADNPGGAPMHFWEPTTAISTPHLSTSTSSPPIVVTPSMINKAPYFFARSPISFAGFLIPTDVSL